LWLKSPQLDFCFLVDGPSLRIDFTALH
jgi:hypothetical protein